MVTTLELLVDYADLVAQVEMIQAIAPAVAMLIAAGVSAAGSMYASNQAGKNSATANQMALDEMMAQKAANEEWHRRRMSENYLDTPEAQSAITKAKEMAADQMAAARGRQAVMGGTEASIAQTQQSVNKMLSDTTSGLAATGTARRDSFDQAYLNRNNELSRQLIDMYGNRAAQSAAAGSAALGSLGNIGSSLITSLGSN